MVDSASSFEAEHKTLLLIASPGKPGEKHLPSVFEDAKKVAEFAKRYNFDTVI